MPEAPKNFEDIICGKVTQESREKYNEDAYKEYNEKALEPCERCGRTFLPDRLLVHLKSCKGTGGVKGKGSPTRTSASSKSADVEEEKKESAPPKAKKISKPKAVPG